MAKPPENQAPDQATTSRSVTGHPARRGNGRAARRSAGVGPGPRPPSKTAPSAPRTETFELPSTASAPEAEPIDAPSTASAPEAEPIEARRTPSAPEAQPIDAPSSIVSEPAALAPAPGPGTPAPTQVAGDDGVDGRPATGPLAWLDGFAGLRDEMVGFARAQLEDAIATGQAILGCGSLPKALELQAGYAVRTMQSNVTQAVRLVRLSAELMQGAATPRKPF